MFYVYMDSFYGIELIGKSETHEGAEKIKAEKDAEWKPGYLWGTRISDTPEKESSSFD